MAELSTERDCLIWGGRVVIPASLREKVKQELHVGHAGCVRMKQLARLYVWWPGLDKELEELARSYIRCTEKRAAPPQSAVHHWERTRAPWQRVHADFAGPIDGTMLLVVVDSFSKWIEAIPMKSTTAGRTIHELSVLFSRFGLPQQLCTDNGPQFTSEAMASFTRRLGIRHIRLAPTPQARHRRKCFWGRNIRSKLDLLLPDNDTKMASKQEQLMAGKPVRQFRSDDTVTQDSDWQPAAESSTGTTVEDSKVVEAPAIRQPDVRTPTKTDHTGMPGPVNEDSGEREQAGPATGGVTPSRQRVSPGHEMSPVPGGVHGRGQLSAEGGQSTGAGQAAEGGGPHEMRKRSTRQRKEPDRYQATIILEAERGGRRRRSEKEDNRRLGSAGCVKCGVSNLCAAGT
ncbi:uncharacterized protein LOC123508521 [Portunus trituberculatus]|uniref:uncharacterized protein LOC123508521 n=1 Tax=Portunus trituberculatus TaxID=210409 RepID=UPI001E1CEE86|nr:uncharacterized protein LOC123508521 [Portunus trituberculatus]